jgi:hypothetical protein
MTRTDHPYAKYEGSRLWKLLDRGISRLSKNGDIKESTARTHIVGYLCKAIVESGLVRSRSPKRTRGTAR